MWIIAPHDYQIEESSDPSFEWFFPSPLKIWKCTSQKCVSPLTAVLLSLFGAGLSCFNNIGEDELASYEDLLQPHDAIGLGLEDGEYLTNETRQSRGRTSGGGEACN
jgi:hypothetical protein